MQADFSKGTITDLADINPPVSVDGLSPDSSVSFIPMADVSDKGQWTNRQTRKLCEVRSGYTAFKEGDVLLAKITPCMENGKGCHAVGLENSVGFGSTEFHVLRAKSDVDARFVFHWSQSEMLRRQAEAKMIGSAGQQRVPADFFETFEVSLFDSDEQRRIAEVLDAVDAAIQRTDTLINKLKWMKAGLLNDLLTRGLDRDGKLRDPVRHPEQFKDGSPFGLIPSDWDYKTLKNVTLKVADRDHTTPIYVEEGVLMVSPLNFFGDEGIDFAACKRITQGAHNINRKKTDIQTDDIIIHRIGAGLGRVRLVTPEMPDFSILHSLAMIRPEKEKITSSYLLWALRVHRAQRQMQLGTQSIGVPDLGLDKIEQLLLPVPRSKVEQQQIAHTLNSHQDIIHAEEAKRDKLIQIKKGLMHDLLTGRVRVPVTRSEVVAV